MSEVKDYFKVLIVAPSGAGKTFAARNLDSDITGYINTENKPLPFRNSFKHHIRPGNYTEAYKSLIELGKNQELEALFLDSFSAYTDSILREANKVYKGYDIWKKYNEEVGNVLNLIKQIPKHMFITAHYEILNIENNSEKRVKIAAKQWEGMIEKEFTVVLYGDSKFNSDTKKPEYWFNTYQQGTSAKCPPDLFGQDVMIII